jgi:hypothetical protein
MTTPLTSNYAPPATETSHTASACVNGTHTTVQPSYNFGVNVLQKNKQLTSYATEVAVD